MAFATMNIFIFIKTAKIYRNMAINDDFKLNINIIRYNTCFLYLFRYISSCFV